MDSHKVCTKYTASSLRTSKLFIKSVSYSWCETAQSRRTSYYILKVNALLVTNTSVSCDLAGYTSGYCSAKLSGRQRWTRAFVRFWIGRVPSGWKRLPWSVKFSFAIGMWWSYEFRFMVQTPLEEVELRQTIFF